MLMLLPTIVEAQGLAKFVLMPNGTYQTEDGKDFIVISFEGKTAHQIYQELTSNVGSTFNDPSKVMSSIEDSFIKIRAFSDDLVRGRFLGLHQSYGGYYQLEFRIKDGRVRISAPIVEDKVGVWVGNQYMSNTFSFFVKNHFKDGKLKEKRSKDYNVVVSKMNYIVNRILLTTAIQDTTENW